MLFRSKLAASTVNTANVYEPLGEPMEGLKDNGQYVITEIRYSEDYPNSCLDITYPNKERDASNPTLIYFHGGGFSVEVKAWEIRLLRVMLRRCWMISVQKDLIL